MSAFGRNRKTDAKKDGYFITYMLRTCARYAELSLRVVAYNAERASGAFVDEP